jgi:hypothetical protein
VTDTCYVTTVYMMGAQPDNTLISVWIATSLFFIGLGMGIVLALVWLWNKWVK